MVNYMEVMDIQETIGQDRNLQAEAFAHFFEASMGEQDKLEFLSNFFPTAFGIFSSMIDSIRPGNQSRVLSRER